MSSAGIAAREAAEDTGRDSFLQRTAGGLVNIAHTVQLTGFGTFKPIQRAARTGKNPSTDAALKIPASIVPKFVAGAKFKAAVDPQAAKRKAEKAGK